MKFEGDIIITDPCYIVKSEDDWDLCEYGFSLEKLNITDFISSMDADCVGCNVIDLSTQKVLGEFASDSSVVSVMSLSQVKEYNPDFNKTLQKNCYAIIKDFTGIVEKIDVENSDNQSWAFSGNGNINFRTDWA